MSASETQVMSAFQYLCPDCKAELRELTCSACGTRFRESNGIPIFLSNAEKFRVAREISATYDAIYTNHSNVWEDQGRAQDFISFFSKLVADLTTGSILEIGCGEGILLAALSARQKAAIDISSLALQKARHRSNATCAVAIAERLPHASNSFDVVVSVGVMEHFLDDGEATREICRVLKPHGYYVALIHTQASVTQRMVQKVREFLFPRFRPVALAKWVTKKLRHPIHQPLQKHYSVATGRDCMETNGFVVERVVSFADRPKPPLAGPHVVIYVSKKL